MNHFKHCLRTLVLGVCLLGPIGVDAQTKSIAATLQDATVLATAYQPLIDASAPHPDFILPSINGQDSIQLSSYRGKKVLLLHFASW